MKKLTYKEMYTRAAKYINSKDGSYKGYTGANALSLYVNDKFNVNAAADTAAHNALCEAMSLLND
ncbi:TPA: hypothetical protein ACGG8C_001987 [Vibrio cholerae]|nr:hypothetical protein [Vibrio cholerae]EGR0600848.1 hypothetical protein [Vibrio cholerae]HDZ9262736.1 hypothetical protein [Vibrio cholerae]